MNRKHLKYPALLAAALVIVSAAGCSAFAPLASSAAAVSDSASPTSVPAAAVPLFAGHTNEDLDDTWSADSATLIAVDGTSFSVDGTGASAAGGVLTISVAGTYVLSGTLSDGQIVVDAGKNDTVRLVLNGALLSCSYGSPIYSKKAGKTILTLAEGTENTVSDGISYTFAEGEDEPNAAIFSKNDLTVNGSGSLTVNANFNNGIGSKDALLVAGGSISVTAANDALRGRDSVFISGGAFDLKSGGDGIQSNNDEDAEKGWIIIDGGSFLIEADGDGIQAETLLQITGGDFNIKTGGGSAGAVAKTDGGFGAGGRMRPGVSAIPSEAPQADQTASSKGVKGGTGVLITGGVFSIDSSDDAVHSNGDVVISSGELTLATGDDGIHSDAALVIDGGTITITQSYEGLEGASITINAGTIRVTARDDGLNAAGGSDASSPAGGMRRDNFSDSSDYFIRIAGGYLSIDASGDGIDSNGSLYFDGGTVLVSGPTGGGDGALDYNGSCVVTGGFLAAAGSSAMAQAPGSTSSQNSLMVYYSATQKAGTLVNLADENGNSLLTFAPANDYQTIVISSGDLEQGKSYALSSGGSSSGSLSDGLYTGGAYSGGTKLADITLSGAVTTVSDNGSAVGGGMGGMGGGGRPQGGGGRTTGGAPAGR